MKLNLRKIRYLIAFVFWGGLTVLITIYLNELLELGRFGYVGIFFACFISNSTVFLPAPSSTIVFTLSSVYSPFWVAIVGGLGAVCGEQVGYVAGITGRKIVAHDEQGRDVKSYIETYGMLAVFVFAFLPLPIFDLVGVAAGAMRMNFYRFLFPCLLGKIIKMLIYAYAGAGLIPMISPLIHRILQ